MDKGLRASSQKTHARPKRAKLVNSDKVIVFLKNKSARAMLFACEADLRAGAKIVLSLVICTRFLSVLCFVLHTKLP